MPRLLPLLILVIALVLYLPWLSEHEWQGSAVSTIEQVADARPLLDDGRTLYTVLAIAVDTLLPGSTTLALNLLSLIGTVLAAIAVARLRVRLHPASSIIEPLVAACAFMVTGLVWRQAVAADAVSWELAVTVFAASLAWGGRPVAGMACFQLALLVSARAILNLPVMLLAIRRREDWKPALAWLLPWLLMAAIVRPRLLPVGEVVGIGNALRVDGLVTLLATSGVALLAAVGAVGAARGWTGGRRFLAGALLAVLLHLVVLGRVATWGLGYVSLTPWLAVLAAGVVGMLRSSGERWFGAGRWAAVGLVGALVVCTGAVSWRHLVAPTLERAARFHALSRDLAAAYRGIRVTGEWSAVRLFEHANRDRLRVRTVRAWAPLDRDRPAGPAARMAVDRLLLDGDLLLLFDQRLAARLSGGQSAVTQLVEDRSAESERADQRLGTYAGGLALDHVGMVPPRPRPGSLLTLRVAWDILDRTASERPLPKVAIAVVDGRGAVRSACSYWLGLGLVGQDALQPGRQLHEDVMIRLDDDLEPGEYGVEVALYEPERGDGMLRDLELDLGRQRRRVIVAGAAPRGVTASALRAATMRIGARPLR
jgi:hypothetical protein